MTVAPVAHPAPTETLLLEDALLAVLATDEVLLLLVVTGVENVSTDDDDVVVGTVSLVVTTWVVLVVPTVAVSTVVELGVNTPLAVSPASAAHAVRPSVPSPKATMNRNCVSARERIESIQTGLYRGTLRASRTGRREPHGFAILTRMSRPAPPREATCSRRRSSNDYSKK
jgi:hypothetical protein